MSYCNRCGTDILDGDNFCANCGAPIKSKRSLYSSGRRIAIFFLLIYFIIGAVYLFYDRFNTGGFEPDIQTPAHKPIESEEPLLGIVYDKQLTDSFKYPGGTIDEFFAFDDAGNKLAIYYDQDSGDLMGFWIALPPAIQHNLDMQQAQQIAIELALKIPLYNEHDLSLLEAELVDHGAGTESFYYFYWAEVDDNSGAILLKQLEISIHPETGKASYLNIFDGGEIKISTEPAVTVKEAEAKALEAAAKQFVRPRVEESLLLVSASENSQRLVWNICIEETGGTERIAYFFCVIIDALSGEVIEIVF